MSCPHDPRGALTTSRGGVELCMPGKKETRETALWSVSAAT
ncbi:hypothetical protein ACFOLD_03030 [Kocuria carniphila]